MTEIATELGLTVDWVRTSWPAMSKDLKKRGFKFVGPTIVYAWAQAVGMVNDHDVTCPRHKAVQET